MDRHPEGRLDPNILQILALSAILVFSPAILGVTGNAVASQPQQGPVHAGDAPVRPAFSTAGSVGSIRISLHNTMANATGPYQQPVEINSSSDASLINANWSNGIAYYSSNDTPIYSWIESSASNASNDTRLWLNLSSIPGYGWTNVSIAFWPKSTFLLSASGYMGEAAELSSSYGAWDNGASVFNFYDNFAGTSLASHWGTHGTWTTTVHNGFNVSGVSGGGGGIYSQGKFGYPAIVDFYGNLYQTTSATHFISEGLGTSACTGCAAANSLGWAAVGTASGPSPQAAFGASEVYGSPAFSTQQFAVFTAEAVSRALGIYEVNYTSPQTLTTDLPPAPLPVGLAESGFNAGSLTNTESTVWIRERTYESLMPSIVVYGIQHHITVGESGLPTGTGWWLNVTGGISAFSRTSALAFNESDGSYFYSLGSANKSFAAPSGVFDVAGADEVESVQFSPYDYPVNFTSTGLPTGTGWLLNVEGAPLAYSPVPTLSINLTNGSYSYSASASNATFSAPPGAFKVLGQPTFVSVPFSLNTFGIDFSESGLPAGVGWSVALAGGRSPTTTATNLTINETNGTYSYTFSVSNRSYAAPGGVVDVMGSSISVGVIFTRVTYPVTFVESGLPRFTPWWVNLSGASSSVSTSGSLTVAESNGTFAYAAARPDRTYSAPNGSFSVIGAPMSVPVSFLRITFTAIFTETGLPTGTVWSVTLDGKVVSGTGNLVFPQVWNGSHPFSVGSVSGFDVSPPNGTLLVAGVPVARSIAFTPAGTSLFGLPLVEAVALIGVVVAIVLLVIAFVARRIRRTRRPPDRRATARSAGPARRAAPRRTTPAAPPGPRVPPGSSSRSHHEPGGVP